MEQKITANMGIKQANRTNIYNLLHGEGALSKQAIVGRLHLCLPTVTQNIAQLQEEGLVEEVGFLSNTGGRRAKTFDVVARRPHGPSAWISPATTSPPWR